MGGLPDTIIQSPFSPLPDIPISKDMFPPHGSVRSEPYTGSTARKVDDINPSLEDRRCAGERRGFNEGVAHTVQETPSP